MDKSDDGQLLRLNIRVNLCLDLLEFRIFSMAMPGYRECFQQIRYFIPMTICIPTGVHIRWTEGKSFCKRLEIRRRIEAPNGRQRGRLTAMKRGGRYAKRKK
jgi:hypothetical protein